MNDTNHDKASINGEVVYFCYHLLSPGISKLVFKYLLYFSYHAK